jgi:hypothetical protein
MHDAVIKLYVHPDVRTLLKKDFGFRRVSGG